MRHAGARVSASSRQGGAESARESPCSVSSRVSDNRGFAAKAYRGPLQLSLGRNASMAILGH